MRFDDIPSAAGPPPDARPSPVVARIRAMRPSRRAVLRALVIGAAAAALVPLDWYLSRGASAAPGARQRDDTSEHKQCMPRRYDEEANNWPAAGPAVCYGGWRRGRNPCSDGYHIEGRYELDGEELESTRLTTNCHGKNAWRWNGYRCSDAVTDVVFPDGTTYHGVTIAACRLPESEATEAQRPGLLGG